jgi:hypothetical protein
MKQKVRHRNDARVVELLGDLNMPPKIATAGKHSPGNQPINTNNYVNEKETREKMPEAVPCGFRRR